MSVRMKKHPINQYAQLSWAGATYAVPISVLEKYKVNEEADEYVNSETLFKELFANKTKPAVMLKGLRTKEGLTQIQFAKKLGITQQNLSAMENGRRAIGKEMAKRIAKAFKIDYLFFL